MCSASGATGSARTGARSSTRSSRGWTSPWTGPEGASTDLLVEKWYRDIKILDIFEGTAQIQRRIIARALARATT